ncbi:MAG: murein L,D-transpeptidase catalytic domain family protein [Pseudomonadota bacterium]
MKLRNFLFVLAFFSIVGFGPFNSFVRIVPVTSAIGSDNWVDQETRILHSKADNLDEKVLRSSLTAYQNARHKGYDNQQLLTIVDYSKPSTEKRLWVVDLKDNSILFNTWVAHGKNSGDLNSASFSNSARSLKSSLGVFVTEGTYDGHNGYSLRVQGLEHGFNDNAMSRAIVFHGADYANPNSTRGLGRLGRSWGCFAVDRNVSHSLINTIKNNTVVVAYYPDPRWLRTSAYLNSHQV